MEPTFQNFKKEMSLDDNQESKNGFMEVKKENNSWVQNFLPKIISNSAEIEIKQNTWATNYPSNMLSEQTFEQTFKSDKMA